MIVQVAFAKEFMAGDQIQIGGRMFRIANPPKRMAGGLIVQLCPVEDPDTYLSLTLPIGTTMEVYKDL